MDFLKWSSAESVGNKLIDDQHKSMVVIVNQIHSAVEAVNKKMIIKLCSELEINVKEHFETEEELMKGNNFQGYISHKLEHDRLYNKVLKLSYDVEEDYSLANMDFLNSFKTWFYNHLELNDKKLGEFLKNRDVNKTT